MTCSRNASDCMSLRGGYEVTDVAIAKSSDVDEITTSKPSVSVLNLLHARKVSPMCYRTVGSISSLSGFRFAPSVRKSAPRNDKDNYIHHSLKKAAFTLAEVLITLGIIGVVAAITMPTHILFCSFQNYQDYKGDYADIYKYIRNIKYGEIKQIYLKIISDKA